MEVLENKIAEMTEDLDKLEFGSEEYERATNSIASVTKANAEDKKIENEAKNSKFKKVIDILTVVGAVGTPIVMLIKALLQRKTNKEALKYEEEDVINSRTYDNR